MISIYIIKINYLIVFRQSVYYHYMIDASNLSLEVRVMLFYLMGCLVTNIESGAYMKKFYFNC